MPVWFGIMNDTFILLEHSGFVFLIFQINRRFVFYGAYFIWNLPNFNILMNLFGNDINRGKPNEDLNMNYNYLLVHVSFWKHNTCQLIRNYVDIKWGIEKCQMECTLLYVST